MPADYAASGIAGPVLGDIIISAERARAQARAYGHGLIREAAFLTAHGMLHLLGYDHAAPKEAAEMERLQEEILRSVGIERIRSGVERIHADAGEM
jgi:probable rRNA maturation factor